MKKELKFIIAIIVFVLLQIAVAPSFKFFGVIPDLLLIVLVLGGVYFTSSWSLAFGVIIGLLKDIFSAQGYAVNVLVFSLWGYFIPRISKKIAIDDIAALPFFVLVVTVVNDIIFRFILLFQGKVVSLGIFLKVAIIGSLYNALMLLVCYKLLNYFKCLPRK